MFTKVLSPDTEKALALLGASKFFQKAYLAGGTGLALQLGHRISHDLDFYTQVPFNEKQEVKKLAKLGKFDLKRTSWQTIIGKLEGTDLGIFFYEYPLLKPLKKFKDINLASKEDIGAMKVAAIASRGTKRDFVDLYFLCQTVASLEELLKFYKKKYQSLASQLPAILRSLVYFEDAEPEEMPTMIKKTNWKEVKAYFSQTVPLLTRQLLR